MTQRRESPAHARPYSLQNFASRWKHADRGECAGINHRLAVHQHLEFAIVAADHIDISSKLSAKMRRHTDGVQPGDSEDAIPNGNAAHAGWTVGL